MVIPRPRDEAEVARALAALRAAAETAIGAGASETDCVLDFQEGLYTGLDRRDARTAAMAGFAEAAARFQHAA